MVKTVFIVDDEPTVRYTVKQGLETLDSDIVVVPVESGMKCFELLEESLPDIILLDIMMPGMNGWEVQQRLKERLEWKKIPIVFLTATADYTSKKIGSMTGEGYIEKPFKIPELKKRIDEIIK